MKYDIPAVVLGMGPTALALVRALGRKGVPVYGIGLSRYEVSLSSRYCTPLGAADPRHDEGSMLNILREFSVNASCSSRPVLYPTGDECVVFIAKNYQELSERFQFSLPDKQYANMFLDKAQFFRHCIDEGLSAPRTEMPADMQDVKRVARSISYPCIIKPRRYHDWALKMGLSKGIVCSSEAEFLQTAKERYFRIEQFIVQEIIPGPETNIYVVAGYFDDTSHAHGVFTGRKIRQYPVGFGTTTMMETVEAQDLVNKTVSFLQNLEYTGLCDAEFKWDPRTNSYKVIEINPRLGRWYGLVEASGCDTMFKSYLDMINGSFSDQKPSLRDVRWVFACRDILALLAGSGWSVCEALRSYRGNKTWCIWAEDDIIPFVSYFREAGFKWARVRNNQ